MKSSEPDFVANSNIPHITVGLSNPGIIIDPSILEVVSGPGSPDTGSLGPNNPNIPSVAAGPSILKVVSGPGSPGNLGVTAGPGSPGSNNPNIPSVADGSGPDNPGSPTSPGAGNPGRASPGSPGVAAGAGNPYIVVDPEVVGTWLGSIGVSRHTQRAYEVGFRTFCKFIADASFDFDSLEKAHVEQFKTFLKDELALSPGTVSLYLSGVRSFYRFSSERDLDDIAKNVRGSRPSRTFKREALTVDQARDLIASFGSPRTEKDARDLAIVSLMVHTGLRDVEVVRARMRDYTESGGFKVLMVHGKGRDEADELVKIVPALERQIDAYLAFRSGLSASSPLFASCSNRNRGGGLTTVSVSGIAKRALRRIGIDDPRYTAHSLRHTAGTIGLKSGASLEEVQAMLRHADLSTTMIYAHHISRLDDAAEDAISKALDA